MNFSKILASVCLIVATVVVLAQAGQYRNSGNHYGNGYGPQQASHGDALAHYGGGGCYGPGCHGAPMRAHKPYGPYHSYAVRPAVYGGRGLYTYKGYARHHPAPPAYFKLARGHGKRAARHGNGNGNGNRYGKRQQTNNQYAAGNYQQPALKPVKVLLLTASHDGALLRHHHYHHFNTGNSYGPSNANGGYSSSSNNNNGHGLANNYNGNGYSNGYNGNGYNGNSNNNDAHLDAATDYNNNGLNANNLYNANANSNYNNNNNNYNNNNGHGNNEYTGASTYDRY